MDKLHLGTKTLASLFFRSSSGENLRGTSGELPGSFRGPSGDLPGSILFIAFVQHAYFFIFVFGSQERNRCEPATVIPRESHPHRQRHISVITISIPCILKRRGRQQPTSRQTTNQGKNAAAHRFCCHLGSSRLLQYPSPHYELRARGRRRRSWIKTASMQLGLPL